MTKVDCMLVYTVPVAMTDRLVGWRTMFVDFEAQQCHFFMSTFHPLRITYGTLQILFALLLILLWSESVASEVLAVD